jgi:hypothetical protein
MDGITDGQVPVYNQAQDKFLPGVAGAVLSVFGRVGAIVATLGDYAASLITNDSGVTGATVKDALNVLDAAIPVNISDLGDVDALAPSDLDVLQYNSVNAAWENVIAVNADRLNGTSIENVALDVFRYGPDLITNGDFANWTGDDPDGWVVSETPPGAVTEGVSGGCRIYSPASEFVSLSQVTMEIGKTYRVLAEVSAFVEGSVVVQHGSTTEISLSNVGKYGSSPFVATSISILMKRIGNTDLTVSNIYVQEITPTKQTGKFPMLQWLQNLFLYSELLTTWSKANMDIITKGSGVGSPIIDRATGLPVVYDDIVADGTASNHWFGKSISASLDTGKISFFIKKGSINYLYILNVSNGLVFSFNPDSLDVVISTLGEYSFLTHPDGLEVLIDAKTNVGSNEFRFYLSTDGTLPGLTFSGDGSVSMRMIGLSFQDGTIADNFPYVKTTTTAETGRWLHRYEDETVGEKRARLGQYELVGDNGEHTRIYKTPIVGEEYFDGIEDGEQIYYQRFEGVGSASTITLIPDGSGVTDIHSWGGSAINSASAPANRKYSLPNTYTGTLNSSADVTTGAGTTGLFLDLNPSLQQAGDSYKIRVRYMKG